MQWISSIFQKCWNIISNISKKCWKFIASKMLEIKRRNLTWVGSKWWIGTPNSKLEPWSFPIDGSSLQNRSSASRCRARASLRLNPSLCLLPHDLPLNLAGVARLICMLLLMVIMHYDKNCIVSKFVSSVN